MRTTFLFAALVLSSPLSAQDSTRMVSPGTSVRVRVGEQDPITGRAVSSTDSSLTLRTSYGLETLRYAAIRRTELRKGSAGRFALIGGLVGASVGVAAAIVFKDFGCQADPCDEDPAIAGGIVFGGIPTAIIGGFIGAMTTRWKDEPRRVSVFAPVQSPTATTASVVNNDCGPGPNGNLNFGLTGWGSPVADGSLVVNCQPNRTLFLTAAYASLPDRRNSVFGLYKTSLARGGLGAERFVTGSLRASFAIMYYAETGTRYMPGSPTPTTQHYSDRVVGAAFGLSAARRVRPNLGLRAAAQLHARPNSNRDPELTLLFGVERMARAR